MKEFLKKPRRWLSIFVSVTRPERLLVIGYLLIICIGFILLTANWSQIRTTSDLDAFFTVVSAVSTTGLTTVTLTDHFSFYGQLVTLILFQIGGLGYMTMASFLFFQISRSLSKTDEELIERDFDLPEGTRINHFIKRVIIFSLFMELIGAFALYFVFRDDASISSPVWYAIYHSVSAFCTTGFTLFSDSFHAYTGHFWFNLIIMILATCGAIGFIVIFDVVDTLFKSKRELSFTPRIILRMTLVLIPLSIFLVLLTESGNREVDTVQGLLSSIFVVMTASTTVGFSTLATNDLTATTLIIVVLLMFIGASPAGTGGGLKITNVGTLLSVVRSRLSGHIKIQFQGNRISPERISFASTSLVTYLILMIIVLMLLTLLEAIPVKALFFETVSALSTVGLSMGITSSLSELGKIVVAIAMFAGRLGVIIFSLVFYQKRMEERKEQEREEEKQNKEEEEKEEEKAEKEKEKKDEIEKKKYEAALNEKDEEIEGLKKEIKKMKKDEGED